MSKLVDVTAAKEFAVGFLPDPILRMAVNAVLDNAPAAEATPKWIPVTERLPDLELKTWDDEDGTTGSYEISEWVWGIDTKGVQCRVRYETGPVFQGWCCDCGRAYAITHWIPLPAPPKGV